MVFNFGDNYYESQTGSFWLDLVVTSIGGLIGFLGALYIYRRTLKSDKRNYERIQEEEQKDALIYFYRLSTGAVLHLEDLYRQITAYVKLQKENYSHIRRIEFTSNNDIHRIKQIDSLLIFKAYSKHFSSNSNWIIEFKKLYNLLDTIEGIENEIKRLDTENTGQMKQLSESIKNNIDTIRPKTVLITSSFFVNGIVPDIKQEEFKFLVQILEQYQKLNQKALNLNDLADNFLQPIMRDLMEKYSKSDYYNDLMSIGQVARTQIADFLRIIENHCKTMEQLPSRFPNTLIDIKKSLNAIQNKLGITD